MKTEFRRAGDLRHLGKHTGGNEPPGGSQLEQRVVKLEDNLAALSLDLQVSLGRVEVRGEQTATKSELQEVAVCLHKALNEQTWKFIAGATSMAALFAAIAFGLARVVT